MQGAETVSLKNIFNKSTKNERTSYEAEYTDREIHIYSNDQNGRSAIKPDENISLLLMQTRLSMADDYTYLYINYDDVYDFYYSDEGSLIEDYKFFRLPQLFNGFIKISNSGNYLENEQVKYSFEFIDGFHPAIKKVNGNIVTVEGEYRILPRKLYECLKSIIEFNTDVVRNKDIAEQFQLLALIKDYANKANLAMNERLRIESKPIVIDKIKLDFEKNSNGLEIKPWIDDQDSGFNDRFLSAFDRIPHIRSFYNIKDNTGKDVKVILKNKEAAKKIKRNRILKGDDERNFWRGINEIFEDDDSFDLLLYGERVVGFGYLNYRANDSISSDNDESWFDACSEMEYPHILTSENKIKLYPQDIDYLQNKLVGMENEQADTTELEFKRDNEVYKLILNKDEIGNEINKIRKAICDPAKIRSKKALQEIKQKIIENPEQRHIEYNGRFVSNFGPDIIDQCIDALDNKADKGSSKKKALLIENNLEEKTFAETPSITTFETAVELPESLRVKLYEHQQTGLQRLQNLYKSSRKNGFLLADDMGLGKTIQILSFFAWLNENKSLSPSLVVAPTTLLNTWDNPDPLQPGEIQKFFAPNTFTTYRIQGTIKDHSFEQKKAAEQINRTNLVFTTYDSLRLNHVWLGRIKWKALICDEIQYAKNPRTLVSNSLKAQNAEFKIACSATPIENSTEDLWNIMDFAIPGIFGSLTEFKKQYVKPLSRLSNSQIDEREQINDQLVQKIGLSFIRRSKEDQIRDLPAKRVIVDYVQLNPMEIQYLTRLNHLRTDGESALPIIQKMVALCSHPRLIKENDVRAIKIDQLIQESSKLMHLKTILNVIKEKDEKAVVFTRFKNMQTMIARAIFSWYGVMPKIINGGISTDKRSSILSQFKRTDGFNVIVLSPEAAGVGITVTEANHVIHYTRLWNPAKEGQATDRVYRIGQNKDVYVYYPISSYDTTLRKTFQSEKEYIKFFVDQSTVEKSPEEKLNRLLVRKKRVLNNFFLAAGEFEVDMVKEWENEKTDPHPITIQTVDLLKADEFEALCSLIFRKMGYTTYLTIKSGDYGVDVVIEKDGEFGLIQSKYFQPQTLPIEALNDVIGATSIYSDMIKRHIKRLVVMSTAVRLTDGVKNLALHNNVEVFLKEDLNNMLIKYPVYHSEIQIENNARYSIENLKHMLAFN